MYLRNNRKITIDKVNATVFPWTHKKSSYFASGREALVALIRALKLEGKSILLPAYLPEGIYAPFKIHKCNIIFYNLNNDLSPNESEIRKITNQESISFIVVIHYFGIVQDLSVIRKICTEKQIAFLEDLAHLFPSPKSPTGKTGDFVLFSLNKIIGVPDGAVLNINTELPLLNLKTTHNNLAKLYVLKQVINLINTNFTSLRFIPKNIKILCDYLVGGGFNGYKTLMNKFSDPAKVSIITRYLIKKINYKKLIEKRSTAFFRYDNELSDAIFTKIQINQKVNHAYFGYPTIVENSKAFIDKMAMKGIKITTLQNKWCFLKEEEKEKFPIAMNFWKNHIIFPTSEHLSKEELGYIIKQANLINTRDE